MPYVKLTKDRGCTASCDVCGYALGSGITNSRHWVKALRKDGWRTWARRGEDKKAWCTKADCRGRADEFLAQVKIEDAAFRNAERREKRRRERAERDASKAVEVIA